MNGRLVDRSLWAKGRRPVGVVLFFISMAFCLVGNVTQGRILTSADGLVSVDMPDDWGATVPKGGAVLMLITDESETVGITVLREPLASGQSKSPVRLLFLKLDNFAKSFPVEAQSNPMPLFVDGEEAARASFVSEVRQADGSRRKTGFVFTCLSRGNDLYTVVGTARAEDMDAWLPILDAVADSLDIR
ncbi:MAG: hypothetical protein R3F07_17670 [Opitutaceae bacterium]